jgi:Mrp family chromosome partitioning ATPase
VLEVKKVSKSQSASASGAAWPSSLYATPRRPVWQAPPDEKFVAEDIMEGCRRAMQQLDLEALTAIGITSSLRGEGRTTLALATALVLAEYGLNAVLLELDFLHPELGHRLGVTKAPGLGDLAEGRAKLEDTMRPISTGLTVIPAGLVQGSIPRALRQIAAIELFAGLVGQGHVVIGDLPPLLGNSVGHQAASLMSDLILVVRAGVVSAGNVKEAIVGLPLTPKVLLNGTSTHVPSWALRLSGI